MKLFTIIGMFFVSSMLIAAPLEGGFAMAPKASASQKEKDRIYSEARTRVIGAAKRYENTPYSYGGITSSGLDCSGLIYLSFRDAVGVNLPRSASNLHSWAESIPFDRAQPGDLLFFRTDNTGRITHVALYLGNRRFIHSASAGARTGVIYNTLDEGSWSRNFAGAGRAFPAVTVISESHAVAGSNSVEITNVSANTGARSEIPSPAAFSWSGNFFYGAAFAPTWNGILRDGNLIRGFSSQLRAGTNTSLFGAQMIWGAELRPEYDGALGVFRVPLTLSWGLNDKYRIFAGPVLSFGSASLSTSAGERYYSGGTSWLGTIGITAAPYIISTRSGDFAPYFEAAWQSYFSDNSASNFNADFSASFRFSTGIRWTRFYR